MSRVFLVNPASANGSTGRRWPDLARRAAALGLEGETLVSEHPGHLAELAAHGMPSPTDANRLAGVARGENGGAGVVGRPHWDNALDDCRIELGVDVVDDDPLHGSWAKFAG